MRKILENFWRDQRGCVPATDWMIVASLLTLGSLAGLLAMQYADWSAALMR